jgi:integrase
VAAKLMKTGTPGIYRRHAKDCARGPRCDCSYVVVYTGRTSTFGTLEEAREGKRLAQRQAKLSRGHTQGLHRDEPRDECPDCSAERADSSIAHPLLQGYARAWVERYQGTGRRGFRQETRDETRRLLERYALAYFPETTRLSEIGPRQVADFIGWLVKQPSRRGGTLTDKSIRNALGPLSACLATARREGLIAHNPCSDAVLPHRDQIEEDEDRPRPFPDDTMGLVISLINPQYRVMFELLGETGVRRSELLSLQVRHLALDVDRPHLKIRQRVRRQVGKGLVIGPLKSRHSRRDLPISSAMADQLRDHVAGLSPEDLAFRSAVGTMLDPDNLADRVLSPACAEAGVEWAGFHTFRHTVASMLFAGGRNAVQVQRWLGHHSPSFTLDTYVHLLDGDLGEPLELSRVKKRSS